jgi:hypothetical protein
MVQADKQIMRDDYLPPNCKVIDAAASRPFNVSFSNPGQAGAKADELDNGNFE